MPSRQRVRQTLSPRSVRQRLAANFVFPSSQYGTIVDNAALSMGVGVHPTVAVWAWLTDKAQSSMFLCKGTTATATQEYMLIYNSATDTFQFRIGNATLTAVASDTILLGSPEIETWYHLVGYYDGAVAQLAINGQIEAVNAIAYTGDIFDGASDFRIGADATPATFASGRASNVAVWKRVLTSAEIQTLYKAGPACKFRDMPAAFATNLQAWYDLDGDMIDKSGGGNNLTNTNAVGFSTLRY